MRALLIGLGYPGISRYDIKQILQKVRENSNYGIFRNNIEFYRPSGLLSFLYKSLFGYTVYNQKDLPTLLKEKSINFRINGISYKIVNGRISSSILINTIQTYLYTDSIIGWTGNAFSSNTIISFIDKSEAKRTELSNEILSTDKIKNRFFDELKRLETYSQVHEHSSHWNSWIEGSIDREDLKGFITDLNYIHSILSENDIKFYLKLESHSKTVNYDLLSDVIYIDDKIYYLVGLIETSNDNTFDDRRYVPIRFDYPMEYDPTNELLISTHSG